MVCHYEGRFVCLFYIEFYSPVNTVKVKLSQSDNLHTLLLDMLSPLSG